MADDWKDKLRQIQESLEPEKSRVSKKGKSNKKRGRGTYLAKNVDPKAKWGGGGEKDAPEGRKRGAAQAALPEEPARGEGPVFNIGIDVGTSALKVCVRPPGMDSSTYVVGLGRARQQESAVCPSTVAIEGGRLWFGDDAEDRVQRIGGQVFRQLKLCVACEVGIRPEVPVLTCRCERMEDGRCSAIFALADASDEVLASDLLTLLLGWAMGETRRSIPRELTSGPLPRCTYSVSAPVDQIDAGSELNGEYSRIVFQAWRLSGAIEQGMQLSTALSWMTQVQRVELPAEGDRLVELCAESAAIVAGHAMSPEMEEGQYAVVDIGAWTTEMSFFRFTETGRLASGRPARAFHAARSHRVAANQIDDRCRGYLLEMYGADGDQDQALADTIRRQREQARFGDEAISLSRGAREISPRASALRFAQDVVAEALARRFQETLREAYEKEKFESFWRGKLCVLLAGGGSLDKVLPSGIRHDFIVEVRGVPEPSDLIGLPACDDYRRFLVAYGLAHGSARWPRDLLPSQTLPFKPRKRSMPTSEELGYGP